MDILEFLKSLFFGMINLFKPKSKLRIEVIHASAKTFPTVFYEEYDPITGDVVDSDIGYTTNFEINLKVWNKGEGDTSIEKALLYINGKNGKIVCKPRNEISNQIKSMHPPKSYKIIFNAGKYYFSNKDNPIILKIKDMQTFYSINKRINIKDHIVEEEFG